MIKIEPTTIERGEQIWFDDIGWGQESTIEEKLWRSVLARAIQDSMGHTSMKLKCPQRDRIIEESQRFFTDPKSSLSRVCYNAGIDARLARIHMASLINEYRDHGEVPGIIAAKRKSRKLKRAA